MLNANVGYAKYKLASATWSPHNEPVSSKSPQKELDLSPPNSGLFFAVCAPGMGAILAVQVLP
jgi:hypothetical protein